MLIWHDVEQNTDEWMRLRCGKIGGSSIGKIMANYGKSFGDPAKQLAVKLAIERISGVINGDNYTNAHMQRGHEQEPIARQMYEYENFCEVGNGGFYENGFYGVSPDGVVDDDGLIEIKSVVAHVHYSTIKRGGIDPAYKWQVLFNLMVSEREWIDFVSFCSEFPEGKRLFQARIHAGESKDFFEMMRNRLEEFHEIICKSIKIIEKYKQN